MMEIDFDFPSFDRGGDTQKLPKGHGRHHG